jgi:hypothetical protein
VTAANQANFLDDGPKVIAAAKIYPPGEEPNPRNPGGISDNEVKRRAYAAELAKKQKAYDAAQAAEKKRQIAAMAAAQKQNAGNFLSGVGSDLKVLAPYVLGAAATAAAVVATGGAAAGALGVAGAASLAAGAATAAKAAQALAAATKGDVGALAGIALHQLPPGAQQAVQTGVQVARAVDSGDALAVVKATLAVPGLAAGAKDVVASVTAAADRLIAGAEAGVAKASEVYAATRDLALAGNADAIKAVEILATTAKQRASSKTPIGQPRTLNAAGTAALSAFATGSILKPPTAASVSVSAAVKPPAQPAPVKPPAPIHVPNKPPAAPSNSVRGQLINVETGRLDFSAAAWTPVALGTTAARRGMVVSDAGRIAFDEWWLPAVLGK